MLLSVCLGIALAAACGFRVFVPLLVVSIAALKGWLVLGPGFAWIGTTPALTAFAVATIVEIGAYYIPWLDNLLDAAAGPIATVAGVVVAAAVMTDLDPFAKWTLAVVAGGGAAGATQLLTTAVGGVPSTTTLGLANPIVATAELAGRPGSPRAATGGGRGGTREPRAAATAFAAARREGADASAAREAYLGSERRLESAEAEVRRLAGNVTKAPPVNDVNYIFPSYVVSQLRGGIAGLVIAVIFAAAMSTLAAEFNSLATATMVDFYKRFVRPQATPAHDLVVSRVFTACWGLFAVFVALRAGQLGRSAIEAVNLFGSYFYGPILGVFGLAVLTPRATARGAFYGLFAGMAAVFLVSRVTSVAFLW